MVSLASTILSLDPGHWYAALFLKDTHFHVSIIPRHRRFLRLMVSHSHYQFIVLPFGASAAPRTFTNCMAVVATFLRKRKILVYPYLDDWLIRGCSRPWMKSDLEFIKLTFARLDLLINTQKSVLTSIQSIEFIEA